MPDTAAIATDSTDRELIDPKTLEPRKKPVENAKEAHGLARKLFDDRKQSNDNFARIRLKYDGEPPLSLEKLKRDAQLWRTNISLMSISKAVKTIAAAFVGFLDSLRYATASRLPDDATDAKGKNALPQPTPIASAPPAADPSAPLDAPPLSTETSAQQKSERFQQAITNLIRSWPGYRTWIYQLCDENTLIGNASVGWLDPYEWRPEVFTFDKFALPAGASHDISKAESIVFRKAFAINELVNFIKDRTAAEDAGWNVDNVVAAINKAMPAGKDVNKPNVLEYADAVREGNLATASKNGAKVVNAYIVLYTEYSGKVSQYIVLEESAGTDTKDKDWESRVELFYSEERFERMADAAGLVSLEWGNGKFYGSIGIGRKLYNWHVIRDLNICELYDEAFWNSFARVYDDASVSRNEAPFRLSRPFVYMSKISKDAVVDPEKLDPTLRLEMEKFFQNTIEVISGSYLPNQSETTGEKATAREIIDNACRENKETGDLLARFAGFIWLIVETIQRRVCCPENLKEASRYLEKEQSGKTLLDADLFAKVKQAGEKMDGFESYKIPDHLDKEAVMCCVGMLRDGLTKLDIIRMAYSPASEPMGDTPDALAQKVTAAFPLISGNQFVDQYRLTELFLSSSLSPRLADELMLPKDQQDAGAIQQGRTQLLELAAMNSAGVQVPISPNDNHPVHRQVIKNAYQSAIPDDPRALAANPQLHNTAKLGLQHFVGHLQASKAKGEHGPQMEADTDFAAHVDKVVRHADAIATAAQQAQAQLQQQQQQQQAAALPAPGAQPALPQAA